MTQWLRLCISTTEGAGWIPGHGTKTLQAALHGQKKKKKVMSKWGCICEKNCKEKKVLYLKKKLHTHVALTPHNHNPHLPATADLPSVFMVLPIPEILYEWNHRTGGLLCLTSFTEHSVSKVYPCCSRHQPLVPFSWLNIIPLSGHSSFCLSIYQWWTYSSMATMTSLNYFKEYCLGIL